MESLWLAKSSQHMIGIKRKSCHLSAEQVAVLESAVQDVEAIHGSHAAFEEAVAGFISDLRKQGAAMLEDHISAITGNSILRAMSNPDSLVTAAVAGRASWFFETGAPCKGEEPPSGEHPVAHIDPEESFSNWMVRTEGSVWWSGWGILKSLFIIGSYARKNPPGYVTRTS